MKQNSNKRCKQIFLINIKQLPGKDDKNVISKKKKKKKKKTAENNYIVPKRLCEAQNCMIDFVIS